MSNNDGDKPTTRERTNRLLGLSSYALGVVLLGVLALCLYDDGLSDPGSLGLISGGALISFAIGYTTSRKKFS